jgi:sec-independent protein translocase protein TatA
VFKSEVNEMKAEDEARKRAAGESSGTSAMREDNSPRTDNQSGPAA